MRFMVDRKQMQAACRNLARLVPETSPIEDLTGILMEADENGGGIRMMATNLEITLEYRREAVVAEGGRMVLNGNLMAGMMPLLSGERVSFDTLPGANVVRIACGNTRYDLSYLSGKHFPEPPAIPMESTAKISGLASLAKRTAFAARQKAGASADMLTNAKLEVYPAEAHMVCTDGARLAIARQKQENSGRLSLLIPAKSLALLAGVCGDDAVEAGTNGKTLVFTGDGFVFTTRTMQGEYPDTNALLSKIKPVYDALVNAQTFREGAESLDTVAEPGALARVTFADEGIKLHCQSKIGSFSTVTDAIVYNATPAEGFHYNAADLHHTLRNMVGNLQIGIDRTGNMLLKGQDLCYLLTPRRPRKVEVVSKQEKKSKTKKAAKVSKTDKAA